MYQVRKMEKRQLVPQVEDEIMNYILQEPIAIGEKIPNEFELAEQFGVGRSTIREAIKSLVTKGILEVRRGSGTFVVSTSSLEDDPLGLAKFEDKYRLALELFEVRLMLEPEIASMASQNAGDEDKQRLKELCDLVEREYTAGRDHTKYDIEFHSCIAQCSGNRVVETLIPIIQTAVSTFVNLTHSRLMQETIETHRAITDAIIMGDPMGARCAMVMHLTYNRQMLMKLLSEHREKQN